MKALKRFGQNYLIDKNIVNKLISSISLTKNDTVLEIGPGKGFITEELCKKSKNIILIEIDSRVIDRLKAQFPNSKIIHDDFNKLELKTLTSSGKLKLVGNIPFNQTGNILFKLIENIEIILEASFIIPFDIAKRIVAKKGTKAYGILTVLFEYFSTSMIIQKVSKNVFFPKPNIDAAIIHIEFNKALQTDINNDIFISVVKAAFGNRRKTLYNSLSNSIFAKYNYAGLDSILTMRAEQLSLEDFLRLTRYIQDQYEQ